MFSPQFSEILSNFDPPSDGPTQNKTFPKKPGRNFFHDVVMIRTTLSYSTFSYSKPDSKSDSRELQIIPKQYERVPTYFTNYSTTRTTKISSPMCSLFVHAVTHVDIVSIENGNSVTVNIFFSGRPCVFHSLLPAGGILTHFPEPARTKPRTYTVQHLLVLLPVKTV